MQPDTLHTAIEGRGELGAGSSQGYVLRRELLGQLEHLVVQSCHVRCKLELCLVRVREHPYERI